MPVNDAKKNHENKAISIAQRGQQEKRPLKNRVSNFSFKKLVTQKRLRLKKLSNDNRFRSPDLLPHKTASLDSDRKDPQDEAVFFSFLGESEQPILPPVIMNIDKVIERDGIALTHAKILSNDNDDINRLIKRLALTFSAKKNEAQFLVGHGIFKAAKFHMITKGPLLSLHINNASKEAQTLLNNKKTLLKKRLLQREINLVDMQFI